MDKSLNSAGWGWTLNSLHQCKKRIFAAPALFTVWSVQKEKLRLSLNTSRLIYVREYPGNYLELAICFIFLQSVPPAYFSSALGLKPTLNGLPSQDKRSTESRSARILILCSLGAQALYSQCVCVCIFPTQSHHTARRIHSDMWVACEMSHLWWWSSIQSKYKLQLFKLWKSSLWQAWESEANHFLWVRLHWRFLGGALYGFLKCTVTHQKWQHNQKINTQRDRKVILLELC